MRHAKLVLLTGALILGFCPVTATAATGVDGSAKLSSSDLALVRKIEAMLANVKDDARRQQILDQLQQKTGGTKERTTAKSAAAQSQKVTALAAAPASGTGKATAIPLLNKSNPNSIYKGCSGFVPLLRQDWKDIDFASCPQAIDKATGAQFSVSNDRIKNNVNWLVHGTAALLYNTSPENYYTSVGGYVTVNRSMNSSSALASSNADTAVYGGVFEFGSRSNLQDVYFANYFRIRAGDTEDHIKRTNAATVTAEWLPVFDDYGSIHIHRPFEPIPGIPLIARFDPELIVQYASATGSNKGLAFNNMSEALRIGPQLTLRLYPGTSTVLSHFHGAITYHPAYETYSGHFLDWLQSSLTYNLDNDGYFALTGSYNHGHDENTGALTNIYMLALSGKI